MNQGYTVSFIDTLCEMQKAWPQSVRGIEGIVPAGVYAPRGRAGSVVLFEVTFEDDHR